MAATVSVSKGVFAFKRRSEDHSQTQSKKSRKYREAEISSYWPSDDNTSEQQHINFNTCWSAISGRLEKLELEIHQSVFKELVEFVASHGPDKKQGTAASKPASSIAMHSIPTAILVTGVNMPDSGQALTNLDHQLKQAQAARHIVRLHSRNCSNVKQCMISLVGQLVNNAADETEADRSSSEDELEDDELCVKKSPKKKGASVKKANCTMSVLEAWHKERTEAGDAGSIVVMLEDCESFSTTVLQDFIQIASYHECLPLVLVLCVATSPAALHGRLTQPVLASLAITTFQARPSHHYLATLVQEVLMDANYTSFRLGGKVFKLLLDMFLYYHLSVNTFVQGFKYCVMEHFLSNPASLLCCSSKQRAAVTANLSQAQLEDIRRLPSFMHYVENLPKKERRPLIMDDDECRRRLVSLLAELDLYYARLCCVVRLLHLLAADVPHAPFGRQVWSVLSVCLNGHVVESEEFGQVWSHVEGLSREELLKPLPSIITILATSGQQPLTEASSSLQELMEDLLEMDELETDREQAAQDVLDTSQSVHTLQPTDRFQLKEKLQELAKKKQGKPNKYQGLRSQILALIKDVIKEHAVPPTTQPLHEVVFFNNSSAVNNRLLGKHRAAITKALADPAHYLQCDCCSGCKSLSSSLPDLSLVYRLHLECGRLINLYDWLQAFCACAQPIKPNEDDDGADHQQPDAVLQARFVQAVSELQFLGFIKTSKRKTDHVARLTWGGC